MRSAEMSGMKSRMFTLTVAVVFLGIWTWLFSFVATILPSGFLFPSSCVFYGVLILGVVFLVKHVEKRVLADVGLFKEQFLHQLLAGLLLFACLSLIQVIPSLLGANVGQDRKLHSLLAVAVQAAYSLVFVGFGEELLFRGYLLARLVEVLRSKVAAAVLASLLFGGWHFIYNHSIGQVLFGCVFGLVLRLLRIKWNVSVLSLSLAHGLYDTLTWIL